MFKHLNEALNNTQKNIIEGTLKFILDDIANLCVDEAIEGLTALVETNIPDGEIEIFKKLEIWDGIKQVRNILHHSSPQTFLNLTVKNDQSAPEVTREAINNFIIQLIERAINSQKLIKQYNDRIRKSFKEKLNLDVSRYIKNINDVLEAAIIKNNIVDSELAINYGADVNFKNLSYNTPLKLASRYNRLEILQLLIKNGAHIDGKEKQMNALSIAANEGFHLIAKELLEQGADSNHLDSYGRSPLNFACQHGNMSIINLLLEHGANPNTIDNDKWSPLDSAINYSKTENSHYDIAFLLTKYGAVTNYFSRNESSSDKKMQPHQAIQKVHRK